ncbi:CPBP family intramembrane metalloprotease [Candidatus Microgenomates bacterium]|nr:CPBP family intramembrane metalloprotease [Candidatus Microgenomates bacterium]
MNKLKHAISLYAFIFVVWGFYRLLFKLPEVVEELMLKLLVWLVPLYWVLAKEGVSSSAEALKSVGWTNKNIFKSIYLAIGLGVLFAAEGMIINSVKYGGSFNFLQISLSGVALLGALGLSLVTAISEETVFRGFIFSRVWQAMNNEWKANILTSIAWSLVHLPITIFVFKYDPAQIASFLLLTFLFGAASSFVYARTGNIASSVLLHVFWEWPIILFR